MTFRGFILRLIFTLLFTWIVGAIVDSFGLALYFALAPLLNKVEASGLIDELLDTHGGSNRQGSQANGSRSNGNAYRRTGRRDAA